MLTVFGVSIIFLNYSVVLTVSSFASSSAVLPMLLFFGSRKYLHFCAIVALIALGVTSGNLL
jgi:hypothetical protein